jgi:glycosyltransferase involved in cell wall biosynthesis
MQPLISVVLPVYNASEFVAQAIQSVLDQTFTDFELIIINDGSTDNSLEIIKSFSDPRIVLINQHNQGALSAVLNGVTICKGEFIARMDHDDICIKDRFEKQIAFLNKHPDVSVVSGAVKYIDEKGVELSRSFPLTSVYAIKKYLLKYGSVIVHPAVMMRRKDFEAVGGYSKGSGDRFHDYHLWVKYIRKGYQIRNESRIVLKYRLLESAISSQFSLNEKAFRCLQEVLICDEPDVQSILYIQKLCMNENYGLKLRVNQLDFRTNNLYNKIKFLGNDFVAKQLCNCKNIYAFFK